MLRTDDVSLSTLTTLKVGGNARTVFECKTMEDIKTGLAHAREAGLPWYVIGGGSNLLASDAGYDGVIIRPMIGGVEFEEGTQENQKDGSAVAIAGAGVSWDDLVQQTVTRGVWGLENLAGIPGSVGAAPVQNIGAYGTDVSVTLLYCDVLDAVSGEVRRLTKEECQFGYRDSVFKHTEGSGLIILRVALGLMKNGMPQVSYKDLATYIEEEGTLGAPLEVAKAVREIRSRKFPDLATCGTAGSFFKNPTVPAEEYATLKTQYPELPGYPSELNPDNIKVSLAWILDHVLNLRGFSMGPVRLFERQPLVLVTEEGATAHDVEALAVEVTRKVLDATGITIEREVRSL